MYLISFPLLLLPFAFFNIVIFLLNIPLTDPVFTIPLMSAPTMPPVFDRSITVTTGDLIVQKSLKKAIKKRPYELRMDTAFTRVLEGCARVVRPS